MSYGVGEDCYFLKTTDALVGDDSEEATSIVGAMKENDVAGLQLVVDDLLEDVVVEATDDVVALTGVWTFDNFDFTDLAGGFITVSGATESGNNGTFEIISGTDGTVTTDNTGLANETFDPDEVTVTVTYPQLEGSWTIEMSNDWTPNAIVGSYDQNANNEGHWTTINGRFSPTIVAVSSATATSYDQYVMGTICARALRFTFVSTAGFGFPMVLGQLRSYS
jgi:hypothetical protein